MGAIGAFFIGLLIVVVSIFMALLILIQRGRGGGITGALGGAGGQSAFGSKAGDIFTRVTVVAFGIWIFLCMLLIVTNNQPPAKKAVSDSTPAGVMGGDADGTGEGDAAGGTADPADLLPGETDAGANGAADSGNVVAPGADQLILPGDEPATGEENIAPAEAGTGDPSPTVDAPGTEGEQPAPPLTGDEPPLVPDEPVPAEGSAPPAGGEAPSGGGGDPSGTPPATPSSGGGQ